MNKYLLCLLITLTFSCNDKKIDELSEETATSIKSQGISVNTIVIKKQDFQKQIISNGKIEALNKSELRFKTSEHLASIKVKNGQTLAILDNAILKNQLNKAKIEFNKAKSKLQEEKINYGLSNTTNKTVELII